MKCPKCFAVLQQIEIFNETYVHSCPKCSGAFYTESELAVPLDLADAKPGQWPCPSCASAMETGTVCGGKIQLDRCTDCGGFWFDAGELESLSKLTGVRQITKPVGAIGDFEEPEAPSETEPEDAGAAPSNPESLWHEALRFLIKDPDSK